MDKKQPDDIAALQAELDTRNRQVAAVYALTRLMSSTLDLDQRLQMILSASIETADARAGAILLLRAADRRLVLHQVSGPHAAAVTGFTMEATQGVAGRVFDTGNASIDDEADVLAADAPDPGPRACAGAASMLTVPLKNREERSVGVIQLVSDQAGAFTRENAELMEVVATIAATAIQTSQRHQSSQITAIGHAIADMSIHIRNKVTPISVASVTLNEMVRDMLTEVDACLPDAPDELAERVAAAVKPVRDFAPESHQMTLGQVQEIQEYIKVVSDAVQGIVTEPQLEPHDLARVVERQLVALEETARKAGVRIVRDLKPVPKCRIDRAQIESAVYQLVCNSIAVTPQGGTITVSTEAVPGGKFPTGSYAEITVSDTGAGMAPQVLQGFLAGEVRSPRPGRAGLGARIAHYAAQAHHAVFEGESEEAKGTTLRLKLPLRGMSLVTPPGAYA